MDYVNIRVPRYIWDAITEYAVKEHRSGAAQAVHWLSLIVTSPSQAVLAINASHAQQAAATTADDERRG